MVRQRRQGQGQGQRAGGWRRAAQESTQRRKEQKDEGCEAGAAIGRPMTDDSMCETKATRQ